MAKNKSIIKVEGTIDKLCFYTLNGKEVVRKAVGPSASRIKNDPAFANVKKNNHEFAGATYISKAIRKGWGGTAKQFQDTYMASRLTGKCRKLIAAGTGVLGQREGNLRENGAGLIGFPLHKEHPLIQVYKGEIHIETNPERNTCKVYNYKLSLNQLHKKPPNATQLQFTAILSSVSKYTWEPKINTYTAINPNQDGIGTVSKTQWLGLTKLPNQWEINLKLPNNTIPTADTALIICLGITYGVQQNNTINPLNTAKAMEIIAVL